VKLLDVNIFIHAHRTENAGHEFYRRWVIELLGGNDTFLYCEWILAAFVRVVTHPRIYRTPTPPETAMRFVDEVRVRPNAVSVMPGARHWGIWADLCRRPGIVGNLVPDAYLAALAIEANAEWVTSDRDFVRFEPDLELQLLRP